MRQSSAGASWRIGESPGYAKSHHIGGIEVESERAVALRIALCGNLAQEPVGALANPPDTQNPTILVGLKWSRRDSNPRPNK